MKINPPELPNVCVICGTNQGMRTSLVNWARTPRWVWLFLVLGIFPAILLLLLLRVQHNIPLPFCEKCSKRRSRSGVISMLAVVTCALLVLIGVGSIGIASEGTGQPAVFGVIGVLLLVIAGVIAYYAKSFQVSITPSFPTYTKKRVEILIPGKGVFVLMDRTAGK